MVRPTLSPVTCVAPAPDHDDGQHLTAPSMFPTYRRQDDEIRGRHLVAARRISKDELIFCERPLCSSQTLSNIHQGALVCRYCRAFCGGPSLCLGLASGRLSRQEVLRDLDSTELVPCRRGCGEVYCSSDCEEDFWPCHKHLCTGPIEDENHPLIRWKQHAIENNEVFLLVGDVIAMILAYPDLQDRFTDFTMVPWWTVATLPYENQPMGFAEASKLDASCRRLCQESSQLLNEALRLQSVETDLVTPLFMAQIIGSFEQNSIGIRARHPLCRDVLFKEDFRYERLDDLIQCFVNTGFIANEEGEDEDDEQDKSDEKEEKGESTHEPICNEDCYENENSDHWDYTPEEIDNFIAELEINELVGNDDMERLFAPLDGMAMYTLTCKMNHSCNPNVVVIYRAPDWKEPLVARCIAKRDIDAGEELCISYIHVDNSYQMRQTELANYGFVCTCDKCEVEKTGVVFEDDAPDAQQIDEAALFGDDEEENEEENAKATSRENPLQSRLEDVRAEVDLSSGGGALPPSCFAEAHTFIVQQGTQALESLLESRGIASDLVDCITDTKYRSFTSCAKVGSRLTTLLYNILQENRAWPHLSHRQAYWVSAVCASLGYAHNGNYLRSLEFLDAALVLGLSRKAVKTFFEFVEYHASAIYCGPLTARSIHVQAPTFSIEQDRDALFNQGLSKPIQLAIEEVDSASFNEKGFENFFRKEIPLLVRGFATSWPATSKWRTLSFLSRNHGHRIVPIELGCMMSRQHEGMDERMMSLRHFVINHLGPSCCRPVWALDDSKSSTAYLAQHHLLDQIPELLKDVGEAPTSVDSPAHINVWIGSGGTRTPLHYDSFGNMFVQLVGVKYVRIYRRDETPKLYISKASSYAAQGNMSEINCEMEDFEKHPLAENALYTETVLFPGDCLFIPCGVWHYVRALSTSVSVNYWWSQ